MIPDTHNGITSSSATMAKHGGCPPPAPSKGGHVAHTSMLFPSKERYVKRASKCTTPKSEKQHIHNAIPLWRGIKGEEKAIGKAETLDNFTASLFVIMKLFPETMPATDFMVSQPCESATTTDFMVSQPCETMPQHCLRVFPWGETMPQHCLGVFPQGETLPTTDLVVAPQGETLPTTDFGVAPRGESMLTTVLEVAPQGETMPQAILSKEITITNHKI